MMNLDAAFSGLTAPCCNPDAGCACSAGERVLRAYGFGLVSALPAMTAAQRDACLDEIAQVEGYTRADYEAVPDAQLARGVLEAMRDYCRDLGLI